MIATKTLLETIDGTWPAAAISRCGPFTLRDGQGGGKRVSAASASGDASLAETRAAAAAMQAGGQTPLFWVGAGQDAVDDHLDGLGYDIVDPCHAWAIPVDRLTDIPIPKVTILENWEPLAMTREIWAAGGIGPARVAVMKRVSGPRTALLGRHNDKPGGAAFVAIHNGIAMLHALEILPHQRRHGLGQWFMRKAAFWARANGAGILSVVCTRDNLGANALYASLGMENVGGYHYRMFTDGKTKT